MGTPSPAARPRRRLARVVLALALLGCDQSATGPAPDAVLDGQLVLSDSVLTRGAVVRAHVTVPSDYELEPGSVRWTLDTLVADAAPVAGGRDTVDLRLVGAGAGEVTATFTVRRRSTHGGSGVSSPNVTGVRLATVVATRHVSVAQPTLAFIAAPDASVAAGAALGGVSVALRDARGHALTGATDSVRLAVLDAAGADVTLYGTTRAAASQGAATFAGLSVRKAGAAYRLVATSPTIPGGAEAPFAVTAGAPDAAHSVMTVARATLPAGDTTTVTIVARDAFDNPVSAAAAQAFVAAATRGTLGAFTCTSLWCSARYTAPTTTGAASVTASAAGAGVSGSPAALTVTAAAAARFAITGDTAVAAGAAGAIRVTAYDAFGNVADDYAGAHALVFSGAATAPSGQPAQVAGVALGASTPLTFVDGVATAPIALVKAEPALLAATDGTIAAAGADRLPVSVTASAPSATRTTTTVDTTAVPANGVTTVHVTVRDSLGNVVTATTPAEVQVTPSAGAIGAFTCAAGVCSAPLTAPAAVGTVQVATAVAGASVPSMATVAVTPGAAAQVAIVTPAAGAASRAPFATQPTVALRDASGNAVAASGTAVTLTVSSGGAVVGTATATLANGVATFADAGLQGLAGSYTLTYAVAGVAAATQNITLGAGAATHFAVTGPASTTAGATTAVTVAAYDADGNVATSYGGAKALTFSGASASPAGQAPTAGGAAFASPATVAFTNGVATVPLTLNAAETAQVAVTDGAIAASGADRLTTTVTAGAPSAARTTTAVSQATVAQGGTDSVLVTVRDAQGNLVTAATPADVGATPSSGTLGAFACSAGVCAATFTATAPGAVTIATTVGGTPAAAAPAAVTVVSTGPAQLALTTPAAGIANARAFGTQPVVEIRDAGGALVTSATDAVTMTVSGGLGVLGTRTVSAVNGVATFGNVGLLGHVGSYTLTFSAAGLTSATEAVTLVPGNVAAGRTFLAVSDTTSAAGGTLALTVTLKDASGNVVTGAAASDFAASALTGAVGAWSCASGVCTATYTAPNVGGVDSIAVSVNGADVGGSPAAVAVAAGSAARLALVTPAAGAASGAAFATQPVVEIRDAGGALVTGATTAVTMTVSSGGAVVGTATVAAVSGVATFTNAGLSGLIGSYTVSFAASGLTGDAQTVALGAGAATRLAVTGAATQAAGTTQGVTVTAYDAAGNVATSYDGAKTLTFAGASDAPTGTTPTAGATAFGGATAATFTNGVATVPLTLVTREAAAVSATDGTLATAPGDRLAVQVGAAAPSAARTTFALSGASVVPNDTLTATVVVRDAYGNVVPGATPADFTATPAAGTLGAFTCASGTCTATYTAPASGGATSVAVAVGGTAVSGSPAPVSVTTAGATELALVTPAAGAASGQAFATQPVVEIRGHCGTVIPGATDAVTLTVSSGGSVVGTYTVNAVNGVATFTDAGLSALAGSYTLTYATAGLTSATQSVTVTPGQPAATGTTLGVGSLSLASGQATTVTVTVKDGAGNVVTTAVPGDIVASASRGTLGAFSCTNGVCTATYTATTAGTASITTTVGGAAVTSSPASITVSAGAAAQVALTTSAAGAASGAAFTTQPVVEVRDASGNRVTSSTDAVTATVSAGGTIVGTSTVSAVGGVATFTDLGLSGLAGTYTATYTVAGLTVATQSVTVAAGAATRLVVTGAATATAGGTVTLTLTAKDGAGNTVTSYAGAKSLTFSGLATSAGGTQPTVNGTATGSATSVTFTNGAATATLRPYATEAAQVAVTDGTLSAAGGDRLALTVSAAAATATTSSATINSATMTTGASRTVTVTVRDPYGNVVTTATPVLLTASATAGTLGAFSCTSGVCTASYTAPGSAGSPSITVQWSGTNVGGSPIALTVVGAGPYLVSSAQTSLAVNEVSERIVFYNRVNGVRTAVTQATAFSLATNGAGGTFYSDANGTASITTASIAAGNDSLVFYYKQTGGGGTTTTLTVTRTSGDAVATGTATMSIIAATTASARLAGEVCSATSGNSVTASLTTSGGTCTAQAGQLVFMVYGHDADNRVLPAVNDPTGGWTLLRTTTAGPLNNANQLEVKVYYKKVTVTGDVTPTFATANSGNKVRMTFSIIAMNNPNATTPIGAEGVASGATVPSGSIALTGVTATQDASALLAYTVQNIGSNAYVAPAGLATITQAGNGGQAITMVLFSKDRMFAGQTPSYSVSTAQTGNAYVGGQVIVNPQ